jgi:hypothetical protein
MSRTTALSLFLLAAMPAVAFAQGAGSSQAKASVGLAFQFMSPKGEFRQNIGDQKLQHRGAFGFDLIAPVTRSGFVSIRFDYMFGDYGRSCLTCRRGFRSTSVGPEVVVPRGRVRPYAMGAWGRLHFEGFTDPSGAKADTGVSQWIYGGGVRVPLQSNGGWSLDVGIRNHRSGNVSYLPAGVQPELDGSVTESARSRVPFLMYVIGFQYQFKS